MPKVRIERIIERLGPQMRKALTIAVNNVIPDAEFDDRELFREFRRALRRKCNTWETVPEDCVEKD